MKDLIRLTVSFSMNYPHTEVFQCATLISLSLLQRLTYARICQSLRAQQVLSVFGETFTGGTVGECEEFTWTHLVLDRVTRRSAALWITSECCTLYASELRAKSSFVASVILHHTYLAKMSDDPTADFLAREKAMLGELPLPYPREKELIQTGDDADLFSSGQAPSAPSGISDFPDFGMSPFFES